MIPDLAQSLGGGRLDAIRRRILRGQRAGGTPASAADRVRDRLRRRARPAPALSRPIPTTHAQILQSIMGKARRFL